MGRRARRGELQYQLDASGIPIGLLEAVAVEGSKNRRGLVDATSVALTNNPAGRKTRQIRPEDALLVADSQAEVHRLGFWKGCLRERPASPSSAPPAKLPDPSIACTGLGANGASGLGSSGLQGEM